MLKTLFTVDTYCAVDWLKSHYTAGFCSKAQKYARAYIATRLPVQDPGWNHTPSSGFS